MKNITEIASGDKYVPWEELSTAMDDNFKELNEGKLSKGELAQTTGSSTTAAMSQDSVTKELIKKQDTLVSGVSIKTINGQSILGVGNIILSGGTGGTVILLKKGTETSYNTTTTTTATGGELYYNSSTVKIYYRVGGVNYTDWNVEGFYTRADVCDPNGTPNTGAFYLVEDQLSIFNGTKMVAVFNGAKIHYLNGIGTIVSGSGIDRLKSALNGVSAFCDAVEGQDTIFYDLLYGCVVVLSAQITGIYDTNKTVQVAGYIQHYNSDTLGLVFHGTFAVNKTAGEVLSVDSWKRENIATGISDAPSDYKTYGRKNGGWEEIKDKVFITNNFFRLINTADSESRSLTPEELNSIFGDNTYTGILDILKDKSVIDVSLYIGTNHLSYTFGGNENSGTIVFLAIIEKTAVNITIGFSNNEISSTSINSSSLIEDAPSDGKKYVRQNGGWVAIE